MLLTIGRGYLLTGILQKWCWGGLVLTEIGNKAEVIQLVVG